jgi:ribosome-associated toxin RatA of RatAB toxin-antitoxin module
VNSTSGIVIGAPPEKIFATVSQLLRWPEFLPHYRFVRQLPSVPDADWTLLHMSAEGGWFPVSWTARFRSDPSRMELHFEHVAAFTKGMRVVWTLTPVLEGTRVEILHVLNFRIRGLRWLMEPVLQHGFIEPVATRTLHTFKRLLEVGV